jgi:hypothetical protein
LPNDESIDPNTDDLDQFSLLLNGTAKPVTEEVEEPAEVHEEDPGEETPATEVEAEVSQEADDDEEKIEDTDEPDNSRFKLKPKKSAKERIEELNAARRVAEREAEEAKRLLRELQEATKTQPQVQAKTEESEPTPDDLDEDGEPKYPLGAFDPAFNRDYIQHTLKVERAKAQVEAAAEKEQMRKAEQISALQQVWQEKVAEVEEQLPDLREKTASLEGLFENVDEQYSEYIASTVMTLDHGPEVLYYLADNPDEMRKARGTVLRTT